MQSSRIIRYLGSIYQRRTAMSVVVPHIAGHDWGWWSREDQRMHLQTVEKGARKGPRCIHVWLEAKGIRMCELDPADKKKLTADQFDELKQYVEINRAAIEDEWTAWIIEKRWLKFSLVGGTITLQCYEKHNSFFRQLNIVQDIKLPEPAASGVRQQDLAFDPAHMALVIKRPGHTMHVELPDVLWIDF